MVKIIGLRELFRTSEVNPRRRMRHFARLGEVGLA